MIRSFRDKEAERIFRREVSRRLPPEIQPVALRICFRWDGRDAADVEIVDYH